MTEQAMSSSTPLVSVVIPSLTDGGLVRGTIRELAQQLPRPHEILLVVNNHGVPPGEEVLEDPADSSIVRTVRFPRPLGKGGAILSGLCRCGGQVIGFVDADGPFPPELLARRLIQPVLTGRVDCAIASKWLGRGYREMSTYNLGSKKVLSRGLNIATRRLFQLPFADTQGGAKFFSRQAFEAICPDFTCLGFDFDVELLWKLNEWGARIEEVYLPCTQSTRSSFRLRESLRMAANMARLLIIKGSA